MQIMRSTDIQCFDPEIGSGVLIRAERPRTTKFRRIGLGPAIVAAGKVKVHPVLGVGQRFGEITGEYAAAYDTKSEFQHVSLGYYTDSEVI
jgi:hypothetical protein